MSLKSNPVGPPPLSPAANTLVILGPRVLTYLAIVSFVLAVVVLLGPGLFGWRILTLYDRMSMLALVALTLTTFTWVLYPHAVSAPKVTIPGLDWSVYGLTGPVVLFFVTLGVLHWAFPVVDSPPATRYYPLEDNGKGTPASTFLFDNKESHPRVLVVRDASRPDDGAGFVAVFDTPEKFTVTLSSEDGFFDPQQIEFSPDTTNGPTITLTKK